MANDAVSSGTPAQRKFDDKIISAAKSQLGVPYLWGGTSEAGFDCSGLTQYCAKQAGTVIPRTSQEQWATLLHVTIAIPGDLVFFKGALAPGEESPGHVGIVTKVGAHGDATEMIDAPYTGTVVRYDFVSPGTAYGIVGYAEIPETLPLPADKDKPPEVTTAPIDEIPHYSGTCLVGLPVLRAGDYGEAVRALGRLLSKPANGPVFSAYIAELVKAYQTAHDLSADGIVGVQTWTSLLTGEKTST
jgi:murein L,D-transpeptidase YcbB/YkuD